MGRIATLALAITAPLGVTLLGVTLLGVTLLGATAAWASDGAGLYEKSCAKCHGALGHSDTPVGKAMKTPMIAGSTPSAADLRAVVDENAKHKALAGKLSDEDLAALASHIATLGGS